MNIEKFTTQFRSALMAAQSAALGHEHASLEPVHVFGMLTQDDSSIATTLHAAGVNVKTLTQSVQDKMSELPKTSGAQGERSAYRAAYSVY